MDKLLIFNLVLIALIAIGLWLIKKYVRRERAQNIILIFAAIFTIAFHYSSFGFKLVSGGTDNHLMLVDLTGMKVDTGKEAEHLLDEVGITVNKNAIPFDTQKPFVTSGIRVGTAAVTSRGFVEEDVREVAKLISLALKDFEKNQDEVRARVAALCKKYPLYE